MPGFPKRRGPITKQDMDGPVGGGGEFGPRQRPFVVDYDGGMGDPDQGDYRDKGKGSHPGIPPGEWRQDERSGTEPRNNPDLGGGFEPRIGGSPTPRRPDTPTPMAGSTFSPMPFEPLPGVSGGSLASPQRRGLYGSMGGLKGGGLGVPLDPVANESSDPISSLIKMLMQGRG